MKVENAAGKIYYGMHFYPGVAEYAEPGKNPFRVFLNEDTMRKMDPSFAGRPIFVEHVDDVNPDLSELRKEADGWVVESFFNKADGKHWVKFIITSDHGDNAIRNGMKLSNAYIPTSFAQGGLWNGVTYEKEITNGVFEHLALVRRPRYEESIILTPEQFKKYNEDKEIELKKLSNSKDKGVKRMGKFNFFKKDRVENGADLEAMSVTLPRSGKEKSITQLINEADEHEMKKNDDMQEAHPEHKVKLHDGSMCNVAELVAKHKELHENCMSLKKENEELKKMNDEKDPKHNDEMPKDGEKKENDEDEAAKKKALELAAHEEKEIEAAKKKNNLDKLKNAPTRVPAEDVAVVELAEDQVARGRARYGRN